MNDERTSIPGYFSSTFNSLSSSCYRPNYIELLFWATFDWKLQSFLQTFHYQLKCCNIHCSIVGFV